ncbi:GntR family transcriptional regulator [Novosphingobium mangrovi (ex Huang et al. 2023)]|uniref:GntR family transcriptional regulator n=1 Tax=Novosphingobium mangrovi (ex Huang et al. 2023) TaxID=2976432 RepID=A0ABT2I291_9SPHN|nr:GntR family transcriptional regulator [Novosphingobium mangrovi (ex Huang et al. 2023)]MCT2398920.1 GntR family transcriptional regulator [Novosphingobium mangrovi (ex Huang et al. 2023)]
MNKEQSTVASQRVADILAERILSGDLAPGARIKQDELAGELETSRIPVRDALRMLEARGLVTMRANAGARVTSLTRRDLEVSYEIRERIEPLLLADSVPDLTDEDIADLRAVMERNEKATDVDEAIALGREFHWITYRRHNTPLLAQMVERVWDTTQSYRRAYMKLALSGSNSGAGRTHDIEHQLLFDAIAKREIETAQAALVMHIRRTRTALVRYGHLLSGSAGEAMPFPPTVLDTVE